MIDSSVRATTLLVTLFPALLSSCVRTLHLTVHSLSQPSWPMHFLRLHTFLTVRSFRRFTSYFLYSSLQVLSSLSFDFWKKRIQWLLISLGRSFTLISLNLASVTFIVVRLLLKFYYLCATLSFPLICTWQEIDSIVSYSINPSVALSPV